jgi:hypothetical protein
VTRLETDGVLKRHKVSSNINAEEMRVQAAGFSGVQIRVFHRQPLSYGGGVEITIR